jgi:rSAM/selenodomain-associated transferase 1
VRRHLIVYAKRPLPGYAKTRLGAAIGAEQAAGVYARLLYTYLLDLLRADLADTRIELAVAAPADVPFFAVAFPELAVRPQVGTDLGQRMAASFAQAFAQGADAVVLTGSDVPDLDAHLVQAAFDALETAPVAVGPATDGGYYLIGLRAPGAPLFDGIEWGTARVLAQTEALIQARGISAIYLPEQFDVDTTDELLRFRNRLNPRNQRV